jgi:heptosyltransferase I
MSSLSDILVIRLSSLGDVLMSIPAVKAIRNAHKEARISWLVEGPVGELLSYQEFIDRVIPFPRRNMVGAMKQSDLRKLFTETSGFMRELKQEEYDVIVDFHGIIKSAILSVLAPGAKRVGFSKAYAKEQSHLFYHEKIGHADKRMHKVERNMLLASHLGADRAVPEVHLTVPGHVTGYIEDFLVREGIKAPIIAVNPFSSKGSAFKRWDIGRYSEVIRRIRDEIQGQVIILWGPGEEMEARSLMDTAGRGVYLSCPTDVSQLFALLRKSDMYIGGDTGVMHLAACARTPIVAIFGPTDHRINGPYGTRRLLLRKELACSPCKNKTCQQRRCLDEITVDEVFGAVSEMYDRIGTS